jgi:predicted amidophosphoribosyltransferase
MAALSFYELSDPYANIMLNPEAARPGVCPRCWTFHDREYRECGGCRDMPGLLDVAVPVTYSVDGGQVHHELRRYKDSASGSVQARMSRGLAAVLWRFLDEHELCVALAAGREGLFDVVTTVPSKTTERDDQRGNLRWIVGDLCQHTADRYRRVLRPANVPDSGREYDPSRYRATMPLDGADVLLVDDTWTRGASVHSAAYALRRAGARKVAVVVIGRHIRPEWEWRPGETNEALLRALPRPFRWDTCAVH